MKYTYFNQNKMSKNNRCDNQNNLNDNYLNFIKTGKFSLKQIIMTDLMT